MMLRDMTEDDLDAVLAIERTVQAHPWTRGNFSDALRSNYLCKVYASQVGERVGYALMMLAVDEAELLNITIAAAQQRKGLGGKLLGEMLALAARHEMRRMVLEVRASNAAARALYRATGFADIGLRRDYYAAVGGREDAILMGKNL